MSKVTIGLIQLETRLGDKEYNLALAQEKVREAAAQGAKIICLPELFVTGYNLGVFGDKLYGAARAGQRAGRLHHCPHCPAGVHHAAAEQRRRAD